MHQRHSGDPTPVSNQSSILIAGCLFILVVTSIQIWRTTQECTAVRHPIAVTALPSNDWSLPDPSLTTVPVVESWCDRESLRSPSLKQRPVQITRQRSLVRSILRRSETMSPLLCRIWNRIMMIPKVGSRSPRPETEAWIIGKMCPTTSHGRSWRPRHFRTG